MAEPYDLTVAQVVARIRNGELSPVALVKSLLGRIEGPEPALQAWVTLDSEAALARARWCERTLDMHLVPPESGEGRR